MGFLRLDVLLFAHIFLMQDPSPSFKVVASDLRPVSWSSSSTDWLNKSSFSSVESSFLRLLSSVVRSILEFELRELKFLDP